MKPGDSVRYSPVHGSRHDGHVYVIAAMFGQGEGQQARLKGVRGRVPIDTLSKLRFCKRCGLGEGEYMACEEPDCGPLE